jgi:NAD(P)-dependent dehydrogenase (short-subunit alcohol dehydrogenase family)
VLLSGKVCVVTGAASVRSIGYATAELFAEHGASVVVVDLAMDDRALGEIKAGIDRKTGRNAAVHGVKCDIGSAADCEDAVRDVMARYGTIDCLVNSAAIVKSQPFLEIAEADFSRMVDVNLKGTFNVCKSVLKVFAGRKNGAIVNLASVAAQRGGGLVGGAHYAASKGGVISLTKAIAREFGPMGIRANVVCPSMTETGMLDGNVTAAQFSDIVNAIPLRRAGRASDIAGACLFLASDLSAYVTGATIDVNGGSHIH